jgi:hypothetical protein
VCDSHFEALKLMQTGGSPYSATLGYFRNNTKLDAAVVDLVNNDVFVILGNGDGTFLTPGHYTVGTMITNWIWQWPTSATTPSVC